MAYPAFTCAYEKDHNPPLNAEADIWFQQARSMETAPGIKNWKLIVGLYERAIEKDHWKAMHNLARLYRTGWPGMPGVDQDIDKMLDLYERMIKLEVPLGYYNWAVAVEQGNGVTQSKKMTNYYLHIAARRGHPLAQIQIGQHFAYVLPRERQDDDRAEIYYRCAGAQNNVEAIEKTASFYDTAKKNRPRSLFYYQRAASLGSLTGLSFLKGVFEPNPLPIYNFGYEPDAANYELYDKLWKQLRSNPNLTFPNLIQDHPLPPHPTQGYDAEHPDRRPEL